MLDLNQRLDVIHMARFKGNLARALTYKRDNLVNLSDPALVICLVCLFCHKYVKKPVRKVGENSFEILDYVIIQN